MSDSANKDDCCTVEAVIAVDERGQMVLPKDVRVKAGIKPGDKLVLSTFTKEGKICCMTLSKVEDLAGQVKDSIGDVIK